MLYIEHDDDGGCFRLVEEDATDGVVGLCTSKSRNVLVRVRDALNVIGSSSLDGLPVEWTAPSTMDYANVTHARGTRGTVLAYSSPYLIVRLADNRLDEWPIKGCRVVEPERPKRDTPSNEPGLGVHAAVALLERWLGVSHHLEGAPANIEIAMRIAAETRKFIEARIAAEPVP